MAISRSTYAYSSTIHIFLLLTHVLYQVYTGLYMYITRLYYLVQVLSV